VNPQNLHHGEDKDGQPFAVAHLGHSDPGLLAKTVSEDALKEFTIYHLEYKRQLVQKLSWEKGYVFRTVRIVDLAGLGSKHLNPRGIKVLRSILGLVQENYPEMVSNVFYVNAPWIFSYIWGMIRPWINASTLEKINILGADSKEQLLTKIDAKQLPKYLGGECTCSHQGGCVPESDADVGMTKIFVGRGSAYEHPVAVSAPVSDSKEPLSPSSPTGPITSYVITWEFRTESYNIDFEVAFAASRVSGQPSPMQQVVVSKSRVDSHLNMIEGGFETPTPGTLILRWDNTFSWTVGKTVLFRVDVVPKVPTLLSEKRDDVSTSTSSSTESSSSSSTSTTSTETLSA